MTDKYLLERIVAMMPIASLDETRPRLMGVLLESCEGGVKLKVCDGHRLIVEKVILDEPGRFKAFDRPVLFKKNSLPLLKLILKEFKHGFDIVVRGDCCLSVDKYDVYGYIEEGFPNTDQLVPSFDSDFEVAFDAKYLYELAKACKQTKQLKVKIKVKDKLSPILCEVTGYSGDIVLMPCRI